MFKRALKIHFCLKTHQTSCPSQLWSNGIQDHLAACRAGAGTSAHLMSIYSAATGTAVAFKATSGLSEPFKEWSEPSAELHSSRQQGGGWIWIYASRQQWAWNKQYHSKYTTPLQGFIQPLQRTIDLKWVVVTNWHSLQIVQGKHF